MNRFKVITAAVTLVLGINLLFPFQSLAQPADVGVQLTAGILSIVYTPGDFEMSPVNIDNPNGTFYSTWNNPDTVDPDGLTGTRDGTAMRVQDARYRGGFELQAQVDADYTSGSDTIPSTNLAIRTENSTITENVVPGTAAVTAPIDGTSYTNFTSPLVVLNGATADCDHGRIGTYTVFPSFRLLVPVTTPAGTYSTTITYTLLEQPTC
jgi:hypothetical protein